MAQTSTYPPDASASLGDISARLDRLPGGRSLWTLVGLLSLGAFCEIYDLSLTPYLPSGLVHAGVFKAGAAGLFGLSDAASFVAATFAGLWLGTLVCSGASDRWGRRPALRWSLVWYSAASVVMGLQSSALGVDVLRFLTGLGLGVQAVAIDCFIAEVMPKRLRGRAFAVSTAIQFCAAPVAAIMALVLLSKSPGGVDGWRWLSFAPGVLAVVVLFLQLRLPESPRWLVQHGRLVDAERIVAALEKKLFTEPPKPEPQVLEPTKREDELRPSVFRTRLFVMATANALQAVGYYGFMNWVPSMLQARGADLQHSLGYSAAIALSFPLAPLAFTLFADKFERKHQLIAGMVSAAIFGICFARQSTPAMWVLFGVLVTVTSNLMSFALHAYQSEVFSTRTRSRAVGFVYSFSRLSTIFSGYAVAYLLKARGVGAVFILLDGALLCAAFIVAALGPRTKNLALEQIDSSAIS